MDRIDNPGGAYSYDAWNFRPDAGWRPEFDLVGYHVVATDGGIGKIDEESHLTDRSYLVVDTGPWIFGRKVTLPAGVVNHIDHTGRVLYVGCTKEQVRSAPEFDPAMAGDTAYWDKLGGHYGTAH